MKFSDGESLILLMLCDLMLKREEIDPEFVKAAILHKQTWALRWQYPGVFDESEPNPPEVNEVVDFLDMWSFIESAIESLPERDKKTLMALPGAIAKFTGFDHNNEIEYSTIAEFLVDRLERFESFKGRAGLNSHSPRVGKYRRMYSVFERIRHVLTDRKLSLKELEAIFAERAWL